MPNSKNAKDLAEKPIGQLLMRFAAPSIVAMLVMSLYNIVDQLFIGHGVGYLGNAATNVVFPIIIMSIALSMLFGEGSTALYSIRLGEKKTEEARQIAGNGIVLLALMGLFFGALCFVFLQPVLGYFGATPAVMPYAIDYAGPIVWGFPFMMTSGGMNALTRANGAPGYAMKSMIVGAVANTILDPIFIFTLGMGVKGAAVATVIAQILSFLYCARYVAQGHFGLAGRHFRLSGSVITKIAACGVGPAVSQLAIMVVIVFVNRSLVLYGDASKYGAEICLAAHGITMKVNQILFAFLLGISMGAQPILGFNYGARNYERVKKTYRVAMGMALTMSTLGWLVFMLFPQRIINLFGTENELYNEYGRRTFREFLLFVFLAGFVIISGTFFQSMAKVVRATLIQMSRQILFMVPALNILPRYWGIDGVLWAGPASDILAFLLALVLVVREYRALGVTDKGPEDPPGDLDSFGDRVIEEAPNEAARTSGRFVTGKM